MTTARSTRTPNDDLARLLKTAAISRKALAAQVNTLSARAGAPTAYTHTHVGNWIRGMSPRPPAPALIAHVLTNHLGRAVSTADIGMGAPDDADAARGLEFHRDPDQALAVAASY